MAPARPSLFPAFGNNRNGSRSLYNASLGIFIDNSIWDARPFSLTGQNTPKPGYNHITGGATFGGPLKIPRGTVQTSSSRITGCAIATTPLGTALVPTLAQRKGDVAPGIVIPQSSISPQARALLNFCPLPNFTGGGAYNNLVFGNFAFQDTRQGNPNIFGFLDTTDTLGLTANASWFHRFGQRFMRPSDFSSAAGP